MEEREREDKVTGGRRERQMGEGFGKERQGVGVDRKGRGRRGGGKESERRRRM